MDKKILFYKSAGNIEKIEMLSNDNLGHIIGMMTRCTLSDGTIEIGFADPFRTHDQDTYDQQVHDYIYLWTWTNLDEETHKLFGNEKYDQTFKKVNIADIVKVEAILYSNPRWGGKLTNQFLSNDIT